MGFLKKLFDQVNVFDGGKTWKNPNPAPAPRPQPAQTPAPQNKNFAGSLSYGKPNTFGPAQTPSKATKVLKPVVPQVDMKNRYSQINAPSYGSGLSGILNKAKDVVDANTPQDQFKRQQVGQPQIVKPVQQQVAQVAKPMAQSIAKPFQQLGNMVVEGNRSAYVDLPKAVVAQATGNKQALANVTRGMDQRLKGKGTFGGGMPSGFTSLDQGKKSFIEDPSKAKSAVGTGVEIGTTVAPMGKGYTVGKQVFSQPIKETGKTLLKAGGANAVLSAGGSAGMQLANTGSINAKQLLTDTAVGTGLGTALPFGVGAVSKGADVAKDPISRATSKVFNTNLNQGGYVQAGPTPKNIHFEDHGTMSDTIDMVKGTYNPTPKERYKLELDASRIGERYGITPIGNNKDPLVNLANGFQKRLDLDQANKVGMFAESGRPVSLNQQGSIPNPLQAFDKLKNKLNGSALDTTVKPATPENVYGVNALEKLGKKLKMNQGGYIEVGPGGKKSVADTQLVGLKGKQLYNATRKMLKDRQGQTVTFPDGSKAVINSRTTNEILNGIRKNQFTDTEYQDLLRSLGNFDEHIAISGEPRTMPNLKENPPAYQKDGFDYRPVNYEVNGRNYSQELNVAKGENQDLVYQYTKPNKNNHLGGGGTDKSAPTYKNKGDYVNSIVQKAKKVNSSFRLDQRGGAIADLPNPLPKNQGGFAKLPGKGAPIEKTITPENLTVVKEYSQMLKSMDDGARGGQMVGNYSDGYKRVTEHSKFYSDYFAKNKRAPSNKAYEEEALRQLKNGQADSYAQKTFDDLQDPEFRSLAGEVEKGSLGKQPLGETFDIPQTATVKTDVKPKAKTNFSKDLPEYDTKKVGLLDKAFRSTRSVIERQGKSGKELAGMLQSQRDSKELWAREIEKRLRTVQKLKDKEFSNFVEATQGKENPMNDKVVKAIEDWKSVHPHIRQRGVDAGLEIGDLGDNYYPHFIDYDKIYKDKNTYNQAINHLVNTGQADTKEKAIELLGFARDTSRNREFGSLEASRIVDLPFYDKTKASLASYIQGSTDRITKTETFGKSDENALKLIKKIAVEGGDTEAAKNAYDIAVGARNYNHTASKISSGIRHYTTVTRLGLGALTNVSQSVNTGIVTGHFRTMGAMLKQLDPKTRQFAEDTGVISDAILNDLRRGFGQETFGSSKVGKAVNVITAPGFKQIESFNRRVAATAGKDYALRLAQKGDDKSINILRKKLGVTGEIDGTLSERQQIQAARKIVEKTQFKVDAQDLPGWTASPGGKLVAQFRTFSYSQGKFFSNEILKPASKGNFMPLGRLMAALPVGYGLYETRRMIDGRPEEENKMKRGLSAFQKVGGAGLAMDAYFALNPLNSKYLPSDRRVSMAGSFLGGPSVGTAMNAVGSLSDMVQRKNSPTDQSRLDGKIALGNNGDTYTDATSFARFGMQQIPIVGSPIMNRVLPYKKSSEADAGKSTQTASSSGTAVKDLKEAKAITKSGYGKEWAKLSEDDIKNKAIEGDEQAQQVYDSLKAMEKVYAPKNVPTKGLSQGAEDILNKSKKFTESGKKAWGSKPSESNDAKISLKGWMNGKDVPVTNEIAVEWAKYEQKRVKGELSPLEQNEAKTTLLRKAYSSSLNEDERKYYSVADDKLIGAVQKGWVSQESINKALAVDKQLLELGLTTKSGFGKKVWNALGLSMPSVAGASSSTRSSGRKSGGRVAKKTLKTTKSKIPQAFLSNSKLKSRRSSTNGSLRKLLSSAKV